MLADIGLTDILRRDAAASLAEFQALIAGVPYERKGILFSEMFFFWLCARAIRPRRILESGRARGQSTLILSLCFPEAEILSVEYDRNSPDVAVAVQRLRGRDNVQQLFGDATRLLPQLARSGDAALIDGPKGYRGLRLALRLLADGNTPMVFMHDAVAGSAERRFFAKHLPEALYSDLPAFAEIAHVLDRSAREDMPEAHRWSDAGAPLAGYGYSLACLRHRSGRNYRVLLARAALAGLGHRLLKTRT